MVIKVVALEAGRRACAHMCDSAVILSCPDGSSVQMCLVEAEQFTRAMLLALDQGSRDVSGVVSS